jgi:peptidoglycan/LPS O-acetylase OafA/YrhL
MAARQVAGTQESRIGYRQRLINGGYLWGCLVLRLRRVYPLYVVMLPVCFAIEIVGVVMVSPGAMLVEFAAMVDVVAFASLCGETLANLAAPLVFGAVMLVVVLVSQLTWHLVELPGQSLARQLAKRT